MAFTNGKCIHSFRHRIGVPATASDLVDTISGTPTIQTGGGRNGGDCVRCTASATTVYYTVPWAQNTTSGATRLPRNVWSFYARYIAKPSSVTTFWMAVANAGSSGICQYQSSNGHWEIKVGSGTAVDTGITPTLDAWYRFDIVYRLDLNPRTMEVRITLDGDATYAFSGTATGPAETASDSRWLRIGAGGAATQTIEMCDVLGSGNAAGSDGDFPIVAEGDHHMVIPYLPNADGSHSVGSATFRYTDNNGTGYTNITNGTTDSYSRINVWPHPADADGADHWVEKSVGTTIGDLVEWTFSDESGSPGTPIGVHTHAAVRNDTGTGSNLSLYQREGTTDAATLINSGDPGAGTTVSRGACYPLAPDGTAWDLTHINAQKVRFSSSDIAPVPRIKAVLMDVAYVYQPGGLDQVLPDADITTTGWSTAPLFSKINDGSDATVITATAS